MRYIAIAIILLVAILVTAGCTGRTDTVNTIKTAVPTIPPIVTIEPTLTINSWKNPDIPGFSKYENKEFNFRLQYPNGTRLDNTTISGRYTIFQFEKVYLRVFESSSPNDVETELFNLADEVRYNSLGHFPLKGQMPSIKKKINFSDSPAILVTWPGSDNNYTHLGIQTDLFGYIFVFNQIEPEKSIVESFELINYTNFVESTKPARTTPISYLVSANQAREQLKCVQGDDAYTYDQCLKIAGGDNTSWIIGTKRGSGWCYWHDDPRCT